MSAESTAVKTVSDGTKGIVRTAENLVKKLWSIMDAASEKKAPGDYLSSKAISSIQGKRPQ